MAGFNGDGVHRALKCTTCHDPHKRSVKIHTNVKGFLESTLGITIVNPDQPADGAIRVGCVSTGCHGPMPVRGFFQGRHANVSCIDCHMAEATKSAINSSQAGWGRKGDLKTHIFRINPLATTITRTNTDNVLIAQNYISPRYACGKCHDTNIGAGPVFSGATSTLPADQEAFAQTMAAGYHDPTIQ
jgi:hypothetical protein